MKQKTSITPRLQQILFIVTTSIFFLSGVGMNYYFYNQGLNGNISKDYTSLYLFNFLWAFAPVVVWGIVHLTRRDRKLSVSSVFQSLLLTFCAMLVLTALGSISSLFSAYLPSVDNLVAGMWWYTLLSVGAPFAIVICGLMVVILHLRRQKQW